MIRHRIVTRGMGTQQLLVSRGYGGSIIERVVEVIQRIIVNRGGKKPKDDYEEVRVWAKMIEYDDHEAPCVEGSVTVRVKKGERNKTLIQLVKHQLQEWAVSALRIVR